ncbi:MAG: PqqD family protein [Geitlerinemataceae cyanobacterium]
MANASRIFRVNAPDVVSETIDGETVIIHLFKGLYYNLNPLGSYVWTQVEAGATQAEVRERLAQQYANFGEAEATSVAQLFEKIVAEELVVEAECADAGAEPPAIATPPETFEAPVLYKYADMQDMLALDPIHDVDEAGWPSLPPEAVEASKTF